MSQTLFPEDKPDDCICGVFGLAKQIELRVDLEAGEAHDVLGNCVGTVEKKGDVIIIKKIEDAE